MRKVTWNSKILKNISKDRDSNFLVMFFLQRNDGPLILATIREDTWNMLDMWHIIPNLKRWDYSAIPVDGHKKIKGPAHMDEGGHHLRTHRVCLVQRPLTLTYIFKVIQPWVCNKTAKIWHILLCPLYSTQFWMNSFQIWHKWSQALAGVLNLMTFDLDLYPQSYLAVTPIYICIIIFLCDTNTTHEWCAMYHFQVKGQGHKGP